MILGFVFDYFIILCFGSLNKNYLFLDYIFLIYILCFFVNLVGFRYLDEVFVNGVGYIIIYDKGILFLFFKLGYDQGFFERKVLRGIKEVNFDIGDFRRLLNFVYVFNELDFEEGEIFE